MKKRILLITKKRLAIVLSLALSFAPGVNFAYIPTQLTHKSHQSLELDLTQIGQLQKLINQENQAWKEYIPRHINTETEYSVISSIIDYNMQRYLNSERVQKNPLAYSLVKIDQGLRFDSTIPRENKDDVIHNFSFQLKAAQSQALIKYKGLLKAEVIYQANDNDLAFLAKKEMTQNSHLAFEHKIASEENLSSVSWNLRF